MLSRMHSSCPSRSTRLVDSKVKSIVGGAALRCWCCKELIFGRADFAVVFVINVYARMPQEAPKAWKRFPGAFSSRSSDEAPSGAYLPVDHEALYKHRQGPLVAGLHVSSSVAAAFQSRSPGSQQTKRYEVVFTPLLEHKLVVATVKHTWPL